VSSERSTRRPLIDKVIPEAWEAARAYALAVGQAVENHGLTRPEAELIKVRASQLNQCAFCLDLHSRDARRVGITPQKLDLLPAWRESDLYSDRERAVLAIAEAATRLPLDEGLRADLEGARVVLGDETMAAAEWVAATINAFNRISILSEHRVRARDADGQLLP
jgi:AhpD family alkylhydroperoxidase